MEAVSDGIEGKGEGGETAGRVGDGFILVYHILINHNSFSVCDPFFSLTLLVILRQIRVDEIVMELNTSLLFCTNGEVRIFSVG